MVDVTASVVLKAQAEQQVTIGVAYPALRKDGHGEFAKAAELERTAWTYLAKHRTVGLWHEDGLVGQGTVVESWIHRGPDWIVDAVDGSTQVVKAGDWCMAVQWDDPSWRLIKSGLLDGYSVQGMARRRPFIPA